MRAPATSPAAPAATARPADLLRELLQDATNSEVVSRLTTPDVTYVSLNYRNDDLHKSMPWCGTYSGPQSIVSTFERVRRFWHQDDFQIEDLFGDESRAAVFGRMTYTSTVLGKTITSPFTVFVRVTDGRISYMQFMEDTFMTSSSFRSHGTWYFVSDPATKREYAVGDESY